MTTDLISFKFHNVELRAMRGDDGEPLFVANDLCTALGYANPRATLFRHVPREDVVKHDTPTKSGIQAMNYVNESGLYALIFASKLEGAKEFKHWVTAEVFPVIRKTGRYESDILRPQAAPQTQPEPTSIQLKDLLEVTKIVLEPAGIEGNQLTLALDKVVKTETGKSVLELVGAQLKDD